MVNREVRQVLEEIAQDETRHAALAWRSLQWILDDTSEEERESVYDLVAELFIARAEKFFGGDQTSNEERDASPAGVFGSSEREERALQRELEMYGVLSREIRKETYIRTFTEVMVPCLEGLLGVERVAPLKTFSIRLSASPYAHSA